MNNNSYCKGSPTHRHLSVFLALAFGYAIFLHYRLGMDAFFDTANYHIYIGWAASIFSPYTNGAAAQYHTYFNPILDIINYKSFEIHPWLGALYHASAFALLLAVVISISNRAVTQKAPSRQLLIFFAVGMGATGAMTVSLYGSFTNEHLIALIFTPALLLALHYLDKQKIYLLLISGFLAGLSTGLKLTAAPLMASLLLSLFIVNVTNIRGWFLAGIFSGIGILVGDGLFMLLRWEITGNPLFPLANNIFQSPLYPAQWVSFSEFRLEDLPQYLVLPFHWLSHGTYSEVDTVRDGRMLLAYVGLACFFTGLLLHKQKPTRKELFIVIFFSMSWLLWILIFRIYRYLVVLELLSGLIFVIGLSRLLPKRSAAIPAVVLLLTCLFLYITTTYPNWGRRPWSDEFIQTNINEYLTKDATVFFAEHRTSFLAPELHTLGIDFANLLSQPWYESNRQGSPIDPESLPIDTKKPLHIIQYTTTDFRTLSPKLNEMFPTHLFTCRDIQTNMSLAPKICSYLSVEQLPRLELGKRNDFRSEGLTFVNGWSHPEQTHRWTDSKEATLEFRVTKEATTHCEKPDAVLSGFTIEEQRVTVRTPGEADSLHPVSGQFEIRTPLSLKGWDWLTPFQLTLELPDARQPNPSDQRLLGIALQSFGLQCNGSSP